MKRRTRFFKKRVKKYNKTMKKGGNTMNVQEGNNMNLKQGNTMNIQEGNTMNDQREGIVDIIKDDIGDVLKTTGQTVADTGLKIVGLERIEKDISDNNIPVNKENSILSNVGSIADKTTSFVLNNINEVLDSEKINMSAKEAAKETLSISSKLLENFNEVSKNPILKEEFKETMNNIGDYSNIVIDSMREPFDKAVDIASNAFQKSSGAAISGAIKVGTDAMAAVPGVGGIIEVGKIVNDGSKAASAMFEAGTDVAESLSDLIIDTKENIKKRLNELEEKKKFAQQITNRTNRSIGHFENPLKLVNQTAGFKKSRRRLLKNKSKRVRFAI
jgi:hypothetical protein